MDDLQVSFSNIDFCSPPGTLLLTQINFNPYMEKLLNPL